MSNISKIKKAVSLLSAVVFAFSALGASAREENDGESDSEAYLMATEKYYPKYRLKLDTSFGTVTGADSKISGELVIPSEIDGITVKKIGNYSFLDCAGLTSVTIPESVTAIGSGAFRNCAGLVSVVIPNTVTTIGEYAFDGCESLTDVYYTGSFTEWNVASAIGKGNENLSNATIHYLCGDLMWTLDGDGKLTVSCEGAMPDWTSPELSPWHSCKENITAVVIDDGVTTIGASAFEGCGHLTSVIISGTVTSIGEYAFWDCDKLASVTVGSGVTTIADCAFYGCARLADVYFTGSAAEWDAILVGGTGNEKLTDAAVHYVSPTPEITSVTAQKLGSSRVKADVETESVDGARLVAVGYGSNGEYITSAEVTDGTAMLRAANIERVKVFAWERLESMKPLCAAKETEAN